MDAGIFEFGRLRLEIEGWGETKEANSDGKTLKRRHDGSIVLPNDFTSGTVRIRTERRSRG
jgi:hypothetical protein